MEKTPHALRVIDDVCATLTASQLFRGVEYGEPTVEGLLALTALPVAWVWDFQDAYFMDDMNTLMRVETQIGIAVVYPMSRGDTLRRVGRKWTAELQAVLLADETRNHLAFLTEPVGSLIQPIADQTDRAALYYQVAVTYYVNRTDPWTNQQ